MRVRGIVFDLDDTLVDHAGAPRSRQAIVGRLRRRCARPGPTPRRAPDGRRQPPQRRPGRPCRRLAGRPISTVPLSLATARSTPWLTSPGDPPDRVGSGLGRRAPGHGIRRHALSAPRVDCRQPTCHDRLPQLRRQWLVCIRHRLTDPGEQAHQALDLHVGWPRTGPGKRQCEHATLPGTRSGDDLHHGWSSGGELPRGPTRGGRPRPARLHAPPPSPAARTAARTAGVGPTA